MLALARKIAFSVKIWRRYLRLKRKNIRLQAENTSLNIEIEALRRLNTQLHIEWANKFLCERKIAPLESVTPTIEEELEPQDLLSPGQLAGFLDMKTQFWKDGKETGATEAQISAKWELEKSKVMSNAKFLFE